MSSHNAPPSVLPAYGDCFLPVSTCSIIYIYSYIAFSASVKAVLANAERILSRAEILQSRNRDDLRNGKSCFSDSKRMLASSGSILDEDVCSEGIDTVLKFHKVILPRFEKFSKLLFRVSELRCKKIMDCCLLTQVKKRHILLEQDAFPRLSKTFRSTHPFFAEAARAASGGERHAFQGG